MFTFNSPIKSIIIKLIRLGLDKYRTVSILIGIGVILLLGNGCKPFNRKDSINLTDSHSLSLTDLFENCWIVPLENTPGSLIAQISQVIYFNNRFYVLDRKQQKIFCFDNSGKFISTISQQGHGPGEYVYVSAINIDVYNKELLLLSPPNQQVLVFDLSGNFRKQHIIQTENVMGLNKIFSLNDSTYLLTSITDYQMLLYNTARDSVLSYGFKLPVFMPQLVPLHNTYQFNGRSYINPTLSREVLDVTEMQNIIHLSFDYGLLNNTEKQISLLHKAFRDVPDIVTRRLHELINSNGYLNHKIIKVMESKRFILQLVAVENNIKHVVFDKVLNETFVFDFFKEDVAINMQFDIHQDNYLITYESRFYKDEDSNKEFFGPWYPFYNANYYNISTLNMTDAKIIANHNPMTDNPFLVVYKFKE